jgi:hypothetical protein
MDNGQWTMKTAELSIARCPLIDTFLMESAR